MNELLPAQATPLAESAREGGAAAAYEQLISPESSARFGERIAAESAQFDLGTEQAAVESGEAALFAQLAEARADESLPDTARMERIDNLTRGFSGFGARLDAAKKLDGFNTMRHHRWQTHGTMLFDAAEADVQPLIGGLVDDASREESAFVSNEAFVAAIDAQKPVISIDATERPIQFPLSAVVSAVGFESWETGRGGGAKKDGRSSREVIEDYAARDTEIPPIDVRALILPDGRVVLMTENAHRVAAAKLRGQESIWVKHLEISEAQQAPSVLA